jgi:cysteinyl-tRNA synthetase
MNDDFNSILIAQLFEAVRYINLINDGKALTAADLETFSVAMNFLYLMS